MTTARTVSFDLHDVYRQAYLVDGYDELPVMENRPEHSAGMIRVAVADGKALLITGLYSGPVASR
ncbi:hypothetical protein [Nonomuraea helvata]|uniref:Uncharacterized protein n=1 Tax=Nonomuraea helvata TaxID=37484 RepID=A0ABV5SF43_9ACTN